MRSQAPPTAPVIVPGTNTIFMAPAPFSARHFAQVERALAARREAALAASPVQVDVNDAALPDVPAQVDMTEAGLQDMPARADIADAAPAPESALHSAIDTVAEQQPATAVASSDDAAHTLAALSAELAAAHPQEAAAPVMETAKVETPPALPQVQAAAVLTAVAVSALAPEVLETALAPQVAQTVAAPTLKLSPDPAQAPVPAAQTTTAKPASPPVFRPAATSAAPARPAAPVAAQVQPKAAAQPPLRTPTPQTVAPQPLAASSDESPVKHAGLKPLFERLAAPEETASPVKSLFSRLLQS